MRDAIKTGIALILLTLATSLLLIAALGYFRSEGGPCRGPAASLFLGQENTGSASSGE